MNLFRSAMIIAAALAGAWGLGNAAAQTPPAMARVGLLFVGPPVSDTSPFGAGIIHGFADRGYTVGKNLVLEQRGAKGQFDLLPGLVDELVASKVRVIITGGYPAALTAKERSKGIPVVAVLSGDPVATGLVQSFARPGGDVTGISEEASELSVKRLQLLKETVPSVHKVAMLWDADDLGMTLRYRAADEAARGLGLSVESLGVRAPDDFAAAFAAMTKDPPDAILMVTDVLTVLNRKRVFEFAAAHHLPAIYEYDSLVHDGGLMSYGPDISAMFDRGAGLAADILEGAKPADLPLELPSRYSFAINLKTAKELGLTIPQSILVRADDVVQ